MTPPTTPLRGGSVTWACTSGFSPVFIFPFTPGEYYGVANLHEFQTLMYRPLYWYGTGGRPTVDYERSLAEPPEWSEDGRTATITVKPYKWSNGESVNADNVMLWMHLLEAEKDSFGGYTPGFFPDNLTGYEKVAEDKVSFTFDRAYSRNWVLMNQFSTITPLPKAWDRTADDRLYRRHPRPGPGLRGLRLPAGLQRPAQELGHQPRLERGQRPLEAEQLHDRRSLRRGRPGTERDLLRHRQALPGRIPAGAHRFGHRAVRDAPPRPRGPGRGADRLPALRRGRRVGRGPAGRRAQPAR